MNCQTKCNTLRNNKSEPHFLVFQVRIFEIGSSFKKKPRREKRDKSILVRDGKHPTYGMKEPAFRYKSLLNRLGLSLSYGLVDCYIHPQGRAAPFESFENRAAARIRVKHPVKEQQRQHTVRRSRNGDPVPARKFRYCCFFCQYSSATADSFSIAVYRWN